MVGTLQNSNGTEIVNYINATTNPISSVATGMVRFVGVTNVQTVYNKEITNSIVRNGTNDGTKLTNIPSAYISELYAVTINADGSTSVLSGTISGGKIIFASVTNAPWGSFSNLVAGKSFSASNAVIDGLTVTNLTGFGHDLEINEDGGNAWLTFDSTPTSSSQIFFNFNGTNAAYIECDTNELGFTFNGGRISIAADGSINIGTGSGAISRINSQIYGIFSTYLNTLQVTNIVGSNYISGRFASLSGSYPSLINGNNANIPTGTNSVLELSGGTTIAQIAGFVATGAGDEFEARFTGAVTNWIVNKSGSIFSTAGTAANRINTGTGGDITLTNQPAWARFRHNGTEWELKSYSR